jgi:multimeric flavodoxin WrbA
MRMIIHDLNDQEIKELIPQMGEDFTVISNTHEIHKCIGCFGCWIKTPVACVINDAYKGMGKLISQCEEVIIISQCYYGGFSPFVKNVLDRSIGYMLPYFVIRNGEMHHESRYSERLKLTAHFYGEDITPDERNIATKLVAANELNLNLKDHTVHFYDNLQSMRGEIL